MTEYHGWMNENRVIYVQVDQDDDRVKMFIQQDRSVVPLATFYNADAAQVFLQWQDEVLALQARVHADLLHKLQNEQPLLFAQAPPMDTVDLDQGVDTEL